VREALRAEVRHLQGTIAQLMQDAVNAGTEVLKPAVQDELVVSGERNLMAYAEFSEVGSLRKAFDLFEQKAQLLRLLEASSRAEGVRIYIGGESGTVPVEDLSVVSAPYAVNGQIVGKLAVVGPTRMPYERMIQIVNITARMVGNALSYQR
jgi:heat-inducible transcriptional repressor